jgi:hypothetical protein
MLGPVVPGSGSLSSMHPWDPKDQIYIKIGQVEQQVTDLMNNVKTSKGDINAQFDALQQSLTDLKAQCDLVNKNTFTDIDYNFAKDYLGMASSSLSIGDTQGCLDNLQGVIDQLNRLAKDLSF